MEEYTRTVEHRAFHLAVVAKAEERIAAKPHSDVRWIGESVEFQLIMVPAA